MGDDMEQSPGQGIRGAKPPPPEAKKIEF